jgi:hypothetical protein
MLTRVFGIDVLKCECGADLKPVSAILKGDHVIKRCLRQAGWELNCVKTMEGAMLLFITHLTL